MVSRSDDEFQDDEADELRRPADAERRGQQDQEGHVQRLLPANAAEPFKMLPLSCICAYSKFYAFNHYFIENSIMIYFKRQISIYERIDQGMQNAATSNFWGFAGRVGALFASSVGETREEVVIG